MNCLEREKERERERERERKRERQRERERDREGGRGGGGEGRERFFLSSKQIKTCSWLLKRKCALRASALKHDLAVNDSMQVPT